MVETETVLDLVPSHAAPATGKNARRSYQKHGFTQPCEADEGGQGAATVLAVKHTEPIPRAMRSDVSASH